jgi:hypothetical protein
MGRDNIKIDPRELGWSSMDRIRLTQDQGPVAGCYEHCNEPSGSVKMFGNP